MNEKSLRERKDELFDYISEFHILTRSEERWEFAKKSKMNKDKLINSNLKAVWKIVETAIVKDKEIDENDFMDLFNSGVEGLYEAVERFDSEYDVRFITYAYHWIRAYVYKEKDSRRIIKHSSNFNNLEWNNKLHSSSISYKQNIDLNDIIDQIRRRIGVILENDVIMRRYYDKDELFRVFSLKLIEGKSYSEIGVIMGLTQRQVYSRKKIVEKIIKEDEAIMGAILEMYELMD